MSSKPTTPITGADTHLPDMLSSQIPEQDFQLVHHEDITDMMLNNGESEQEDDGEGMISFVEAMNTMYHEYPSMQSLLTLHQRTPDTNPAHHLVTSAIFTQFWLHLKKKNSDGNTDTIKKLEQGFIWHWKQFLVE